MEARSARRGLLLSLGLLALAATAPAQPAGRAIMAAQPAQLLDRLERERVVLLQEFSQEQAYGGFIRALVIFEQPLDRAMQLLVQVERQHEFRPELARIKPVLQTETGNLSEYHMKIMLMRIRYRAHYRWDRAEQRIWWSLDPDYDNGLEVVEGSWELFELDGDRTLARFATKIDVGAGLPAFLQDFATRQKVPEAMENTRKWVDSNGEHRP
jgi:hypothetical protein